MSNRSPADAEESFRLGSHTVQLKAWKGLHLKKLPELVVMLLRVEFLKPDGQPRYKQPIWLLWTGPTDVPLQELCKMYLWRFAIEHMFRFLKQNLGLNTSRSNTLVATEQWMWLCALAYWQLLLMRNLVEADHPAWYPGFQDRKQKELTPGLVQRAAFATFVAVGHTHHPTQSRRKRKRSGQRLSSNSQSVLSGGQKGENRPKTGPCQPVIAILVDRNT